ncbi:MAG: hypothetical protein K2Q06_13650, partial [Parvularculaceae bacterium]|nr:hypothetical protein [Parvularculaceae bacterium]
MRRRSLFAAAFCALCVASPAWAAPEVWQSAGYGYVFQTDGKRVETFDLSSRGCVRGPRYKADYFHAVYGALRIDSDGAAGVLDRPPTKDRVARLKDLPSACLRPLASKSALLSFDVFDATFAERYPFFAARGVDWSAAAAEARVRVAGGGDLFETLSTLVAPLDGRVMSREVVAGEVVDTTR